VLLSAYIGINRKFPTGTLVSNSYIIGKDWASKLSFPYLVAPRCLTYSMNSSLIDPKGCIHFMTLGVYVNKKVFINMANIHSGGGLQVATSFICELVNIEISDFDLYIFLSSEVNAELARLDVKVEDFSHAYVENNYG
jgi:hypothetical protein